MMTTHNFNYIFVYNFSKALDAKRCPLWINFKNKSSFLSFCQVHIESDKE